MYILTCYTSKRNETKQQSQKPTCCMSSTLWGHVCVPCTHFSLPWFKAPLCLTASCSALVATVHFQGAASDHMKTEIRSWSSSALNPPAAPASLRESQCPYSPQAPQAQPCRLPFRSHRPPAPTLLSSQTAPLFHTHTHTRQLPPQGLCLSCPHCLERCPQSATWLSRPCSHLSHHPFLTATCTPQPGARNPPTLHGVFFPSASHWLTHHVIDLPHPPSLPGVSEFFVHWSGVRRIAGIQ